MDKPTKTKITQFDRTTCRIVSKRVEEALAVLADELGVKITAGRGTFTQNSYALKVEIATIGQGGEVNTRAAEDFKQYAALYAALYGMEPDDLGKTFVHRGRTFRITGLRPRSSVRYPVLTEDPNGKAICFAVPDVLRALRPNAPLPAAAV